MGELNLDNVKFDHIDELTGLYNLNGLLSRLQSRGEVHSAGAGSVIIYLNVMNFKTFNQRYGFVGGNEFLKGMADEIRTLFPDELAARTGGDQFIILGNSLNEKEILDRLHKFREVVIRHQKGLTMRIKPH